MAKKKKATRAKAKAKPKARKSSARAKTSSRRNTAAKRTPAAKAAPFKAPKLSPASTPRTKSQIVMTLSEQTGLTRKDVTNIFSALTDVIGNDMGKRGCGLFTVPGLMKIRRVNKPATKARKGINPFTGEETVFKAKPARNVVKVRPLKALKDMC